MLRYNNNNTNNYICSVVVKAVKPAAVPVAVTADTHLHTKVYSVNLQESLEVCQEIMIKVLSIFLVCCCVFVSSHKSCYHPWTLEKEENGKIKCECGNDVQGIVKCDSNSFELHILQSYCMTYSESLNTTVGHCAITLLNIRKELDANNTSDLNEAMCGSLKRTGQLCGGCKEGYAPPVYSYGLACVRCSSYEYNWLKYIAIAFVPLTAFYILVLILRLSALSGNMDVFILLCQLLSAPEIMQVYIQNFPIMSVTARRLSQAIITLYGIWNLDFFRTVYEPFCLHPRLTNMEVLLFDYVVAVYPLLLIFLTYICVSLHDKYRIVVFLWKPFYKCLAHIRREWYIHKSLVDVFATFLLLSFLKLFNVSFSLLVPTVLYDIHGQKLHSYVLYIDGTVNYFSKDHIPYAILAIIMLCLFNIAPVIVLFIYPCRSFHRCLNRFPCQLRVLHTFMDAFHGSFKTSPFDCRYFAALYLLLRIVNVVLLSCFQNSIYLPILSVLVILVSVLVSFMKPRRYYWYNIIDVLLLVSVSTGILLFFIMNIVTLSIAPQLALHGDYNYVVYSILITTPAVYFLLLLLYSVTPRAVFNLFQKVYTYSVGVWKSCRSEELQNERLPLLIDY